MTSAEIDSLQAEIDRLRSDLAAARDAARAAEHEAGALRGTIAEMQVQLARARQDQERFQQAFQLWNRASDTAGAVRGRIGRLRRN